MTAAKASEPTEPHANMTFYKSPHCRTIFIALVVGSLLNFGPISAHADSRDPVIMLETLSHLPLRAPIKMVQKLIQDRLRKQYRGRIKAQRDALRRDELKRELQRKNRAVMDSYEELIGKSQYDLSVIGGEFKHNAGDALLRENRRNEDIYYFFNRGRIWKVIATMDPSYDFGSSVLRLVEEYGPPDILEFKSGSPSLPPIRALWETDKSILELADRRRDFGCYTILRARKDFWKKRVGDRHSIRGEPIDPLIEDVTRQSDDDDTPSNIVDEILKGNIDSNDKKNKEGNNP